MRRLRWLHVRAAVYLVMARVALSFSSFRRLARSTPRNLGRSRDRAEERARALVAVARRLPLGLTCLHRALALVWLLRADGLAASLRIGVRPGEGVLAAHAWVEHDGVVLFDEDASAFVPFDAPVFVSE
jgi:hypothetical protein